MSKILIRFLAIVLGLFVAAEIVPGITLGGIEDALVFAILLALINLLVRPVLIVFTLPITILTLGLFIFILNAILFLFVDVLVSGIEIDSFVSALLGSIVVSIVSWFIQKIT
ncbi:TPA: hypothetical protein DEP58_00760 [Patescibacteria group bacterium]|nr:MAG: hypothetical protein UU98_C0024G0012 [Parcubacteria group bacterium GW2011_GWD2_42_14]HCC04820.1 hypothetical protein [Patescibacteria group bacterium]